jgi:hypothetical protein
MLWNTATMKGYAVSASDGYLGAVSDLLFDDASWEMRWLVVSTRDWFPSHQVLLPVSALGYPDPGRQQFIVTLTRQQIQDSPRADWDPPVSRQTEVGRQNLDGHDLCWANSCADTGTITAQCLLLNHAVAGPSAGRGVEPLPKPNDPHLRSIEDIIGHRVHAVDGLIGHVDDFLIEDRDWRIRYIKVDTRNWGPDCRVLLSPRLIRKLDWQTRLVHLDVDRQTIEHGPQGNAAATIDGANDETSFTGRDIKWAKE